MAEVDVKDKRIFCGSSHPDVFCKKGPLKYLAKLTDHPFDFHIFDFLENVWNYGVAMKRSENRI